MNKFNKIAAAALLAFAPLAPAQTYPDYPISLISPFSARIAALPDVTEAFMKPGAMPTLSSSSAAIDKMVHTEITTHRKVRLQAGIKPE